MPTTGELAKQNIKDRYFGVNDPVAKKMMGRVQNLPKLQPPEDTSITTLFVGTESPHCKHSEDKNKRAMPLNLLILCLPACIHHNSCDCPKIGMCL